MLIVIATIEIEPGRKDEFLRHFKANVPHVLAEEGCLEYAPTVDHATDIAAQGPLRQDTVTIVERWQDLVALKNHLVAPHMLAYREHVKDLVRQVELQVLEPV